MAVLDRLHWTDSETTATDAARYIALVAVEFVIGIHAALTPMHLEEKFYIGALFTIGNLLLFGGMLAMVTRRFRAAGWLIVSAVCAGEFLGFVLSRTTGLPEGYKETWASATEDYLGLASMFLEVVVVAAAYFWTVRRRRMQ